jgi:hypothetical protein
VSLLLPVFLVGFAGDTLSGEPSLNIRAGVGQGNASLVDQRVEMLRRTVGETEVKTEFESQSYRQLLADYVEEYEAVKRAARTPRELIALKEQYLELNEDVRIYLTDPGAKAGQ